MKCFNFKNQKQIKTRMKNQSKVVAFTKILISIHILKVNS